jgi:hypothetical protein
MVLQQVREGVLQKIAEICATMLLPRLKVCCMQLRPTCTCPAFPHFRRVQFAHTPTPLYTVIFCNTLHMTIDFAAWFAQQLLEACTSPLLSLSTASSPSSSTAASAPLSLLVETPLAIPSISGLYKPSPLFPPKKLTSMVYPPLMPPLPSSIPPHAHNLPLPLPPIPRHAPRVMLYATYFPRSVLPGPHHRFERFHRTCHAG